MQFAMNGAYSTNISRKKIINQNNEYETNTTYESGFQTLYQPVAGYDILRNIRVNIEKLANESVKKSIIQFSWELQQFLYKHDKKSRVSNYLPPLLINELEDGSVLIEWIFTEFRIAFSFEIIETDSFVILLTSKEYDETSFVESLTKDNLKIAIFKIMSFVLRNS